MSPYRSFCIIGAVLYTLFFFLLEKITKIPFISNRFCVYILVIVWIFICIVKKLRESEF